MISSSLFRTGRLDLKKIHSQKLSEKIAFVGFVLHKVRREFMRVGGGKVLSVPTTHKRQGDAERVQGARVGVTWQTFCVFRVSLTCAWIAFCDRSSQNSLIGLLARSSILQ
jgi:hypothetical protein